MRLLHEIGLFFPEWWTPWIGVAAIGAAIMGWYRLAAPLAAFVAIDIAVVPLLEPWIEQVPVWFLVLLMPIFALLVLYSLIALIFGKGVADQVIGQFIGTWLVRLADLLIAGPFRVLWWLLRSMLHRG
jgi:hypothetical protein